jgi:hypothetical protein
MAFEQLMADAQIKKEKKSTKSNVKEGEASSSGKQWSGNTEFKETWDKEKK